MEKKDQKEELQSRRDFFKKTAKGMLPVLGAIVLAHAPILSYAEDNDGEMGCDWGCYGGCKGGCGRVCSYGCTNSCSGSCSGACKGGCQGSCKGGCRRSSYY